MASVVGVQSDNIVAQSTQYLVDALVDRVGASPGVFPGMVFVDQTQNAHQQGLPQREFKASSTMGKYFEAVKDSMTWLSEQPDTLFLGQAVAYPGTFVHGTLVEVPEEKRLEVPVSESFQMQMTVGLALDNIVPISIYPRQNFLLLATGDMSNIVDKISDMTQGRVQLPMIIRTAAGTTKPLDPGHQHIGNYAEAFRSLFSHIDVVELHEAEQIMPAYQKAYRSGKPSLLIEFGDHYQEK